jgi:hypothetical protein
MCTETISLLTGNRITSLNRLENEKEALLAEMKIAMDSCLPYYTLSKRIKEINGFLLMLREMPD